MLLNKYQIIETPQNRGYSITAEVQDSSETVYLAKWIRGIQKDSHPSKVLFEKLRHLKRAEYSALPKIIEYNWDDSKQAYCIIFEYKNAQSLENLVFDIPPAYFLKGIEQIINCLQLLNINHRVAHGDITPANILVDDNFDFYLIDFGIADIATTLSQAKNLEIFAKQFAAPEKWDRKIPKGFPYQSDIFSIGKVIEWYFEQKDLSEFDQLKNLIDLACHQKAVNRINYNTFSEGITKILEQGFFEHENTVEVTDANDELITELSNKDSLPVFNVSPNNGDNILLNIATENYKIHCLWLVENKQLLVRNYQHKTEDENKYQSIIEYGHKLDLPIHFKQNAYNENFDLTPYFRKVQTKKEIVKTYKGQQHKINVQLNFYKNLLNKELEVLEKNSLRLRYVSFEKHGKYGIHFKIAKNDKYSNNGFIGSHINEATPPSPKEFEYILSGTSDKKKMKNPIRFSGVAYDFYYGNDKRILRFKDCEHLDFNKIPQNGYIFQNISKEEQEKKRQLEAIRRVEYDETQNRTLTNALFFPQNLEGTYLNITELETVYQKDDNGNDFKYSSNQTKAVRQALEREPLSVIQGPPGTGKTTVITEIVFQILAKEPNATILITSQTNDAVDNVLDNLLKNEIPIVRLSGFRHPKISLQKHTMERKIEGWKEETRKKAISNWTIFEKQFREQLKENALISSIVNIILKGGKWKIQKGQIQKIIDLFDDFRLTDDHLKNKLTCIEALNNVTNIDIKGFFQKKEIHNDWLATVSGLSEQSSLNEKLISSIRVIGATTNHIAAGKYRKYGFEFDYVIMDESGKATLAESLVPLTMGNKAILVGDHRQLRPMLTSTREVEKWLRAKFKDDNQEFDSFDDYYNRPSLFEDVITGIDEDFKSQLETCRRCSIDQVRLISECFYEPFGDEKIHYIQRPKDKEHNLDLKVDSSIIFLDIGNDSKSRKNNGSSFNPKSAELIPQLLIGLDQFEKVKGYEIGVITGYTAQLREINKEVKNAFRRKKLKNINLHSNQVAISVVDRFQGLEKDIIIFDLVRSLDDTLGFLSNANRINVALSRQKKLLIIIGNYDWLISAKSPNTTEKAALQKYLRKLKQNWIVKNIEQIF
jgi:superfamily I DNA and/or RNA helicase